MDDLEAQLIAAQEQRFRIIVTDGVFSMDGNVAPMDKINELAHKYNALVMVDECHSAGVVGETGRGVTELFNIRGQVDVITGTLGKAFGGAIGGFTTAGGNRLHSQAAQPLRVQLAQQPAGDESLADFGIGAGDEVSGLLAGCGHRVP